MLNVFFFIFWIIYKLKQWLLQVSGDGNNHVVPYTMAHQKGHED
jgi:hypothetical protein